MKIYQPTECTPELVAAFERLIPQLNESSLIPTCNDLTAIIASEGTFLFIGEENGEIVGTVSAVVYKIPTGTKAWIEDVIVDKSARGKGYGKLLMAHALNFLKEKNIASVNLTSSPHRKAAIELYRQLGFKLRETGVFRLEE